MTERRKDERRSSAPGAARVAPAGAPFEARLAAARLRRRAALAAHEGGPRTDAGARGRDPAIAPREWGAAAPAADVARPGDLARLSAEPAAPAPVVSRVGQGAPRRGRGLRWGLAVAGAAAVMAGLALVLPQQVPAPDPGPAISDASAPAGRSPRAVGVTAPALPRAPAPVPPEGVPVVRVPVRPPATGGTPDSGPEAPATTPPAAPFPAPAPRNLPDRAAVSSEAPADSAAPLPEPEPVPELEPGPGPGPEAALPAAPPPPPSLAAGLTAADAAALRVFVHHPRGLDPARVAQLVEALRAGGLGVVSAVPVGYGIGRSSLGFYHAGDRAAAERIWSAVARLAGPGDAAPRDFTDFTPRPRPGTLEIWLAGAP